MPEISLALTVTSGSCGTVQIAKKEARNVPRRDEAFRDSGERLANCAYHTSLTYTEGEVDLATLDIMNRSELSVISCRWKR